MLTATTLGAIAGIESSYALSFLVFEQTGSTFAAGMLIAMRVIPQFILPIVIAPWMDRMPRKPFLVFGDLIAGILFGLAGLFLKHFSFSYSGYLLFSLILACVTAVDSLTYNSIFPKMITEGYNDRTMVNHLEIPGTG